MAARRAASRCVAAFVLACLCAAAQAAPADTASYVGGAACAECHAAQMEKWRGSHHQRAMEPASAAIGNFDGATFTYEGITSTFEKRGAERIVRTDGADGNLHDFPVAYTFGIDPLQQLLIGFPGGRYQALSIAWDSRPAAQGGQRWFHLYPNEKVVHGDVLHWTTASQNWNSQCADCHSTNVRRGFHLDSDSYQTTWTDLDVSCEACHGPGAKHVAWARAGKDPADATAGLTVRFREAGAAQWSFDPGAPIAHRVPPRSSRVETETCAPCHARRGELRDPALVGAPLLESYRPALLEEGLYYADGQIQDEVYEYGSFVQSKMFHAGVTCSDCHEPHSLALRAEGNALCGRCHSPVVFDTAAHHHHKPGSAAANCVECHMPARTYMVVHQRRDHSFRNPRPDLAAKTGAPNTCNACHTDRDAAWAAQAIRAWPGTKRWQEPHYGEAIAAGRRGDADAATRLAALIDDAKQPAIARATAASLFAAYLTPRNAAVLQRALASDEALLRLGALDAALAVPPQARPALALPLLGDPMRAVRIAAARAMAAVPAEALTPEQRLDVERSLTEYRQAQEAQAERPGAHLNLALVAIEQNHPAEGERELKTAIRLAPQFVPSYVNLADLYRGQGRDAEAEPLLRRAIELAPEEASTHHALGLLYVRQKRIDEALVELRRAVDLAPDNTRNAYVLAIALHSVGRTDEALALLRRAHERRPADRDVLVALATVSRDAGATAEAQAWAAKLVALDPSDPGARQLAAQLGAGR